MSRFAFYPIARAFTSMAVIILTGFLSLGACSAAFAQNPAPGQVVGFVDGQGRALFLHDFKGKPVIINMWATWCGPCIAEMPSLDQLQKEYAAKGLQVIALSEDDSITLAVAFYKSASLTALAPYLDKGHAVWAAIEARGIPTTLLINRNGDIVQRVEGPVDWQSAKVHEMVDEIMK